MALRNFKDIINNKAYFINSKDRKIFEQGDYTSFFGFGEGDVIEFVVYDVNDNQLEQSSYGLVRYIPLNNENIKDYLLLPDGTVFQALSLPKEYFIDVERLLNEAGFDNGIFKTQVTLINRRVGGYETDNKLWISEISPSRTELRLLPLKKPTNQKYELDERFKIFISDKDFRDDTIQSAIVFLEKINPAVINTFLINRYSDVWTSRMKSEYKISNVDEFCTIVYNKFLESAIYEFTNRYSDIKSLLYGQPKPTKPSLQLSKDEIKNKCTELLINSISFYLITPDVKNKSDFQIATEQSVDEVSEILQTRKSDVVYGAEVPEQKLAILEKPIISNRELEIKRLIQKELIILPDMPPPIKEPVLETLISGGSGGFVQSDFGTGFGRERIVEGNFNRQNIQ
jgi:hypothetical protein